MDSQEIALIRPGVFDADARAAYAKAFDAKRDTTGGLGTMERCLADAMLFDVVVGGVVVGRYALKQMNRAQGVEVFIVAAAGRLKGVGLIEGVLPHIMQQCATVDRLTINTRRRGLVKKLTAQGWTMDSYVMRKKMQ